ncbi:Putative adenylate kinase [Candidatus Tiddalikarchaeum anstoanum]|nr:Putative adenylate kinase [Candidatus Tiddalikarchaeum anstoanum]
MKILVTGTPGTGKTTNSKKLAKALKLPYFSTKEIINDNPNVVESVEKNVKIIKPCLKKLLEKFLPHSYVLDTHLIEYAPKVDVIVVLRCEPFTLAKRLKKRNYPKNKIMENVEAEIVNYFSSSTNKNKVIEIDTSKIQSDENVRKIMKIMRDKKWNKGLIVWDDKKYSKLLLKK